MIQALDDKIIAEEMIRAETKGGIVIPDNAILDPQSYGRIISVGENVPDTIKVGDVLTFHRNGGQVSIFKGQTFRILKYDEVYGKITDEEIISELDIIKIEALQQEEPSQIIRPVS